MKNVKVVIGANFGDEGKGLMTNYFASVLDNPLVVRFNGGAQAGHTVIHEGKRIVFSHFSSGTSLNALTYLSEDFICNPLVFVQEYKDLERMGIQPRIWVHPNCRLTTPFEMIINQELETFRGADRHGSCGIGIFETIKRSEEFFKLTVSDLKDLDSFRKNLTYVRDSWVDKRFKELGVPIPKFIYLDHLINAFIEDCKLFLQKIKIIDNKVLGVYDNVIFEGAQGLLLDQHSKYFPHATPSNTGLTNIVKILKQFPICPVEICYVTRTYLTRHGAGPLETECEKPYDKIVDETNQPNEWQGMLRFGILDAGFLKETIDKDFTQALSHFTKSLSITCMDQVDNWFQMFYGDHCYLSYAKDADFVKMLEGIIKPNKTYCSYGPNKESVKIFLDKK